MEAKMHTTRRGFLKYAATGVAVGLAGTGRVALAGPSPTIKAVAFDGFPIIDPRPVQARAEELFPGRGTDLANAWRTRQFEYTWLRTLSNSYIDFWQVTEDALIFAAKSLKLELSAATRRKMMDTFLGLKAWPDAPPALRSLKEAGVRVAFLSNFTERMLDAAVRNSGLNGIFEPHLSTDRVAAYKLDARAYRMALDAFGLKQEQIAFAASAGWDAAGARRFGYPTFWVNRMGLPAEELGVAADASGTSMTDLLRFVRAST